LATEHAASVALGSWVAAVAMAADDSDPHHKVAMAKAVCQESAEIVTGRTHQTFGAIGMTREHELHFRTRRTWAWSAEWGSGDFWAKRLSAAVLESGADQLWPMLSRGIVR
jgi:acyl-CoA dehydrogenase